ncbi:putative electron transfer flavoprotein beta subunit [Streptomyces albus]|nr:putative electron transfer flavoprotein beta subunit [Streptomyces albus]
MKYVPDATGDRHFAEDLTVDRDDVDGLLSELDEYAVEQALQIADEADDAEITVLTVGPQDAKDALRKALSMGADKGIHVEDDDLHGTDAVGTSLVLAKAIEKAGYDLVVSGMASTDGVVGVVPALLAERLGVPQVTLLSEVSVADGVVKGRRDGDAATEELEASLPAVVSVTDQSGEARYPSFKGSWRPRRSRWSPGTCPTWAWRPGRSAWRVPGPRSTPPPSARPVPRARSSRTRARAASSSRPFSRSASSYEQPREPEVHLSFAHPFHRPRSFAFAGEEVPWLKFSSMSTTWTVPSASPPWSC